MINRRGLIAALKLIVSIALVAFLFNQVGSEDALARLLAIDPGWLAIAVAIMGLQMIICTARWRVVLTAIDAPLAFWEALRFWYVGAFFNQVLPSSVGGDVVRGYLAFKRGLSASSVFSSLFIDRLATVLALVLLVAAMVPFMDGLQGGAWFSRVVWLTLAGAVGGTAVLMVLDRLPGSLTRFRIVRGVMGLALDARRVLLRLASGAGLMAWSLAGHVNLSVVMYALFQGLGADVAMMDCLVLFPPVLMVQILPVSVAGWGVREGALVARFALVGGAPGVALAASIVFGLALIVVSLPGAVLWLAGGQRALQGAENFTAKADTI